MSKLSHVKVRRRFTFIINIFMLLLIVCIAHSYSCSVIITCHYQLLYGVGVIIVIINSVVVLVLLVVIIEQPEHRNKGAVVKLQYSGSNQRGRQSPLRAGKQV